MYYHFLLYVTMYIILIIIISQLSSALTSMGDITSHRISEATRLTYTQVVQVILALFKLSIFGSIQVYNQICQYAASLSPPVILDITKDPIPADVIISYFRKNNIMFKALFV